jgi:hypothetical protein
LYQDKIIDATKLIKGEKMMVGYMLGGIRATVATSSTIAPTSTNAVLYEARITWD